MRMIMKVLKSGEISYAIQNLYRLVYALFCIVIGSGFIVAVTEGSLTVAAIIPVILFLLGLIGLTYQESWVFDPHAEIVKSRFGVAVFIKKETIPSDKIRSIEITHFVRGGTTGDTSVIPKGRNKAMVVFSIVLNDNTKRYVEIIPEKTSAGRTEKAAQAIAAAMNLPFYADREYDNIQKVTVSEL